MPSAAESAERRTATTREETAKKDAAVLKRTKTAAAKRTPQLRVRQVRSGIGRPHTVRRTLIALGLKHHQDEVLVRDNPSIRGMLNRVQHLVSVTPEES